MTSPHWLLLPALAGAMLLPVAVGPRLEEAAERLGRQAGSVVSQHANQSAPSRVEILTDTDEATAVRGASACGAGSKASNRARDGRASGRHGASHAVFIGHDTMLRIVNERAVPDGRPVPRAGQRPAGIQLLGVTPMGLGMQDGDILTDVEGRSVTSEAAVVGAVVAALSRHAPTIQARFFRAGRPWMLVVEIPYDAHP